MSEAEWDVEDMSEVDSSVSVADDEEVSLMVDETPSSVPDIATPLTSDEARELTETIRGTADVLYTLLARAHAGKAWVALGYGTFENYVNEEFDISRSRAYQILNQSHVIAAIEAATPEGTHMPNISEAAARDLKSVIGDLVPAVEERTAGLDGAAAGRAVQEIVEEFRNGPSPRAEPKGDLDDFGGGDFGGGGFGGGANGGGFGFGEDGFTGDAFGAFDPDLDDSFDLDDPDEIPGLGNLEGGGDEFDPGQVKQIITATYELFSAVRSLAGMPDAQMVVDGIPEDRRDTVSDSLKAATTWLAEFSTAWEQQPWQTPDVDR